MRWLIIIAVLILQTCTIYTSPINSNEEENVPATTMDELQIPPGFTWSTSVPMELTVEILTAEGLPFQGQAAVSLYRDFEDERSLILTAFSDEKGIFKSHFTLNKNYHVVSVNCNGTVYEKRVMIEGNTHVYIRL